MLGTQERYYIYYSKLINQLDDKMILNIPVGDFNQSSGTSGEIGADSTI